MNDNVSKDVLVKIRVDNSEATSGINDLNNSIDEFKGKIGDAGKIDLSSVKSFKEQLRQSNIEAQKIKQIYGENSKEFRDSVKHVAALKEEFKKTNDAVAAFNPDNKLQALVNVARGAQGALEGVGGAMLLVNGESEKNEVILRKLRGLMFLGEALGRWNEIKDSVKNLGLVLGVGVKSATQITEAMTEAAVATKGQTVATEGLSVANETATGASKALGIALKSIGIGLIIAAIAYLITSWDKLKESIEKLFPSLGGVSGLFNKSIDGIKAFGSAILKYVATPIKVIVDLFQGEFKKALADFKDGVNIVGNTADAYKENQKQRLIEHNNDLSELRLKDKEDQVKVLKAAGKETYQLEKQILDEKIRLYQEGNKELLKGKKKLTDEEILNLSESNKKEYEKYKELYNDKLVADAEHAKKVEEDAKKEKDKRDENAKKAKELAEQQAKSREEELKSVIDFKDRAEKIVDDSQKEINKKNLTEREAELQNIDIDSKTKIDALQKDAVKQKEIIEKAFKDKLIDKNTKDKQISDLEKQKLDALNSIEQSGVDKKFLINKKYDEDIKKYLTDQNNAYLSEYDKTITDINKDINDKLINAVGSQREELEKLRNERLGNAKKDFNLGTATIKANTKLVNTKIETTIDEKDSPEERKIKVKALFDAQVEAEDAAFAEKKEKEKNNKEQLEQLEAEHNSRMVELKTGLKEADKKIDDEVHKGKKENLNRIGDLANAASDIAGKNTTVGKGLAVASTTISTYAAAQSAYQSQITPGDPTSPFRGAIAAAVAIAQGIARVKSILAVQVPNSTGSSSTGVSPTPNAPTINPTVFNPNANTTQNVRVVNPNNTNSVSRTYIVDKDLTDQSSRNDFLNRLSTF